MITSAAREVGFEVSLNLRLGHFDEGRKKSSVDGEFLL